jgi:hypothetical protein
MTPAEERAEREGLPVVLMIAHDLLRVASGHPMIVSTVGGGEALVRLPSPEELLELSERAGRHLAAKGLPRGPGMSRVQAEELAQPLAL